jgi:hypothetical protein
VVRGEWGVTTETERRARQGLTAVLALYGAFLAFTPDHYGLIDSVDLPIHEAGHPLFSIFGEFIGYAGGTLMQLLVPAVFLGYFWWAYLLGRMGLLRQDRAIAGAVHLAGVRLFLVSCLWGWMYASAMGRRASAEARGRSRSGCD